MKKGNILLKSYPEQTKKAFNCIGIVNETWVYYYQPQRKCSSIIKTSNNAKRTVKKVLKICP